jgi:hypothetical protein
LKVLPNSQRAVCSATGGGEPKLLVAMMDIFGSASKSRQQRSVRSAAFSASRISPAATVVVFFFFDLDLQSVTKVTVFRYDILYIELHFKTSL